MPRHRAGLTGNGLMETGNGTGSDAHQHAPNTVRGSDYTAKKKK